MEGLDRVVRKATSPDPCVLGSLGFRTGMPPARPREIGPGPISTAHGAATGPLARHWPSAASATFLLVAVLVGARRVSSLTSPSGKGPEWVSCVPGCSCVASPSPPRPWTPQTPRGQQIHPSNRRHRLPARHPPTRHTHGSIAIGEGGEGMGERGRVRRPLKTRCQDDTESPRQLLSDASPTHACHT